MSDDDVTEEPTDATEDYEVLVVGGGVAGLTAALYTARAGLDTLVCSDGESTLARNAHLENYPGFPAGVDPRLFTDMLESQATRNGVDLVSGRVAALDRQYDSFVAATEGGDEYRAARVVAASWADAGYLDDLGVELRDVGEKRFVDGDGDGRTDVDGLYVAGRLAERYHQAVVAAGDGARVGITVVHDSETPYYNDWVVPEGYFSERGYEVPPGCEEIDATEQAARQAESRAAMQEYFADAHDERQRTHPSLVDDDRGRLGDDWE